MQIWVGLGNPGAKYSLHRHNVGFMAADIIAEVHDFGPWSKKFRSLIAEGRVGRQRVLLLKPQTFMNLSGQSVGEAMRFYKLQPADVTVFYDELDLAPGKIRVKVGGGSGGHPPGSRPRPSHSLGIRAASAPPRSAEPPAPGLECQRCRTSLVLPPACPFFGRAVFILG